MLTDCSAEESRPHPLRSLPPLREVPSHVLTPTPQKESDAGPPIQETCLLDERAISVDPLAEQRVVAFDSFNVGIVLQDNPRCESRMVISEESLLSGFSVPLFPGNAARTLRMAFWPPWITCAVGGSRA